MLNTLSETLKFSVSGMRGLYGIDLNPANMVVVVRAFANHLGKGDIALARDNRPTGPAIMQLVKGVLSALGRNVYDLDMVPTPTIKHFVKSKKLAGGIMISASHNPIAYTAFKFIKKEGDFFEAAQNQKLNQYIQQKDDNWGSYQKQGQVIETKSEAIKNHIDQIIAVIFGNKIPKFEKNFVVALDTLGACAHDIAPYFLQRLKVNYKMLFSKVSYDFPRPPEPTASALKKLQQFVSANRCALGFAFDPDADRLALVDDLGRALSEETTLPLALDSAFTKIPKTPAVVNLSTSYRNNDIAQKYHSQTHFAKVGEANVVAAMRQKKSVLGGEGNGGVIDLRIDSCGRDSLVGMAHILNYLSKNKVTLSQWEGQLLKTTILKQKIDLRTSLDTFLRELEQSIEEKLPQAKIDKQDGIKIILNNSLPWLHIRPSNTEPIVRLIAEGNSKKEIDDLLKLFSFLPIGKV